MTHRHTGYVQKSLSELKSYSEIFMDTLKKSLSDDPIISIKNLFCISKILRLNILHENQVIDSLSKPFFERIKNDEDLVAFTQFFAFKNNFEFFEYAIKSAQEIIKSGSERNKSVEDIFQCELIQSLVLFIIIPPYLKNISKFYEIGIDHYPELKQNRDNWINAILKKNTDSLSASSSSASFTYDLYAKTARILYNKIIVGNW